MPMDAVDVLGRDGFIEKLVKIVQILSKKKRGCCFGIDGAWGSGKTFVLEKFERLISELQSEETADDQFYVFHYDCWKYDYYEEPLLAIVIAMLDAVQDKLSRAVEITAKDMWEKVKQNLYAVMGEACKNKIGINLVEMAGEMAGKIREETEAEQTGMDPLSGFRKVLEKTRKEIEKIAEEKTMVIVVDELDRCLPEYSIKVLERLHHIFDGLDNVIVIVSMDKSQLEKSIVEIFGEIDVDIYLRKFIAFKVDLDKGHANMYSRKFGSYFAMFDGNDKERGEIEQFFADILQGFDMRTQERIFRKAQVIHEIIEDGQTDDCSIMAFEILYLTAVLKTKSKDIRWLCNILKPDFLKDGMVLADQGKIEQDYLNMLKGYAQKGIAGEQKFRGYYYIVLHTMIGKTFFWLSNALYTYDNGICGDYYYSQDNEQTVRGVEQVKRFAELIEIVSCD